MPKNNFKFSKKSANRLQAVNNVLSNLMYELLEHSPWDFAIVEGRRTKQRQQQLFDAGKAKTLDSLHIRGEAVDIVPVVNGFAHWDELKYYYDIANCFNDRLRIIAPRKYFIRWGGCWTALPSSSCAEDLVHDYKQRCKGEGRTPFLDFCHFEIRWRNP